MTERGRQLSFGDTGMELVPDLDTGEQTLRRRRTRKSVGEQAKLPAPIKQWWERVGLPAFNFAAEGWRQNQSAKFAETFGHNVESARPQMNSTETEELLKRTFARAKSSRISSLEVVGMMRAESLSLEERFGTVANWLPPFVDSAIDLLAEVYGLKSANIAALKTFAHQRRLPRI